MCDDIIDKPIEELEPIAIFGFDGKIASGLKVHPDGVHMIYALGNKISITNTKTNKQEFLCGHTNTISNLDISKSGALIASGQINHMGFRAYVIIWDWKTKKEILRHELHKVRVEALCFTSNEMYLITLGGRDDGMIIVWDIKNNSAICGAHGTTEVTGAANTLRCLHRRGAIFLSAGEQNLRLWCINKDTKKLMVQDVLVGKIRREYTGMAVNARDEIMYAGTMSGDIVKIRLNCHNDPEVIEREKNPVLLGCFGRHNPKKPLGKDCEKYNNGVRALLILPNGNLIIGAGDGTIEMVEERNIKFKDYPLPTWPQLKKLKRTKVNGPVSSLEMFGNDIVLIGTEACEIYNLKISTFDIKLLVTCNTSTVYDIAFPHKFSLVFATASYQSVRIWSTTKMHELLRIMVPNFSAAAIIFSYDGKQIVTAWNDGVIRSFTPLTGKLIYAIPNAHNKGCSALTISSCGKLLVSGGCEGQIRVWKIEATRQSLIGVLKEHTAPIATVDFNCFDSEIVSSSSDGTCIIWDISRMSRKHVLYANTQFTCARYYPSGVQILTTGSDRRISYWEVYDASLVRDIEGSNKGSINCIAMNNTGEMFLSVGNEQIVKLWDYQTALPKCTGYGHAAVIVTCRFSPCGKFIVSGSADGAIFIWKVPEKYWPHENADPLNINILNKNESSSKLLSSSSSSSKESLSNKNRSKKSIEHINELETSRSNKDIFICECPPIDMKSQPDLNENCVYEGREIVGGGGPM